MYFAFYSLLRCITVDYATFSYYNMILQYITSYCIALDYIALYYTCCVSFSIIFYYLILHDCVILLHYIILYDIYFWYYVMSFFGLFCSVLLYCDIIWSDIQTHIFVEERFGSTGVSCIILRQHFNSRPGTMVIRSNKLWTDLQCISPHQHRPKGTSTIYPWSVEVQEKTSLLGGFPCQPSCSNVFWVNRSLSSECWRLIE